MPSEGHIISQQAVGINGLQWFEWKKSDGELSTHSTWSSPGDEEIHATTGDEENNIICHIKLNF